MCSPANLQAVDIAITADVRLRVECGQTIQDRAHNDGAGPHRISVVETWDMLDDVYAAVMDHDETVAPGGEIEDHGMAMREDWIAVGSSTGVHFQVARADWTATGCVFAVTR